MKMETSNWIFFVALLGLVGTFIGFAIRSGRELQSAKDTAEAAKIMAAAAAARADLISAQLSEFKLLVAQTYASDTDLKAVETRLVGAIDQLATRFDRLADRLTNFLDRQSQ